MSNQLVDARFADPDAARMIVRRLRMRAALNDAQASIEELLDILKHGFEADRDRVAALFDEAGDLVPSEVDRLKRNATIERVAGRDVREKEFLDGMKLVLDLLDRIGVGIRHGLFSSRGAEELKEPRPGAHRLCEVSE